MILDQLLLFITVQCPHGPWKPLWLTNCIDLVLGDCDSWYQITKYFIVASSSLCAIIFLRSQVLLVNHDNEAFIKIRLFAAT